MNYKFLLGLLISLSINAKEPYFENPILRGSYPDPSICRVGDDFYMVNSSFEYYPGLPIHHSKDLVNWKLIGYGLHRISQCNGKMNLTNVQYDGGIHAPSIRYHNGKFYIITTNVYSPSQHKPTEMINFIITSQNIEGPWSDPIIIEDAPGIDPDIIFDDDKIWYVGTHSPKNPNFNGEGEIWLQELDSNNWELIGERFFLWRGALHYGTWAEGPHIYKKNGYYYLLIAEGGTSLNHAIMIAVSDNIRGPYIPNDRNPILTSRHITYGHWVNSVGHGDLIELKDGRWYLVTLGIRSEINTYSNMGRETHLIPVSWEKEPFEWKYNSVNTNWSKLPKSEKIEKMRRVNYEWPVCSPTTGRVEKTYPLPFTAKPQYKQKSFKDDFDNNKLKLDWNFRRVPNKNTIKINHRDGLLRLFASSNVIENRKSSSLLGIRQRESDFEYEVKMLFKTNKSKVQSGISLFQKDDNYIICTIEKHNKEYMLKLLLQEKDNEPVVIKDEILNTYDGSIIFKVNSKDKTYSFQYSLDNSKSFNLLAQVDSNKILSKGYTGAYLGLYATTNGQDFQEYADFDWVTLK